MNKPLVSIIIPSYNQGRFIRDTIESCLSQEYRPIELIIIDGASTDQTLEILNLYDGNPEVRWISAPDKGVADAVNKGLGMSHGEIAAIQSSDDMYEKGAIAAIVSVFLGDPELGIVYGDCITVDEQCRETYRFKSGGFSIENFLSKKTLILQPSAFFRLDLAREIGGWNEEFFNADTEMWLRMIFRAPARKIDRFLARRRRHEDQRNAKAEEIVESYWRMINTCEEIREGPWRWRRAARCGTLLHAAHYTAPENRLRKRWYMWLAALNYPVALARPDIAGTLLPGFYAIAKRYRRIKSLIRTDEHVDG